MKNLKKLLSMTMVVLMLAAMFCVVNVSAGVSGGVGKLYVSHFNQDDVYSNAAVIFTKEYLGDKTLADVSAEYKGRMNDKLNSVDPTWTGNYADHGFSSYIGLVCTWNEENAYYEVTKVANYGECSGLSCPDNGFIFAMHHDDDVGGTKHNYPSNAFSNLNFDGKMTGALRADWNALANQPVYLYNIDLTKIEAGSGIQTSGKFFSKMSEVGLDNGLKEVFDNFKTESYLSVGQEDADATVAPYEPANVTVSFKRIDNLQAEMEAKDELEYSTASWKAYMDAINNPDRVAAREANTMTNKDVAAWAAEIIAARDALQPFNAEEEAEIAEEEGDSGSVGKKDQKDGGNTVLIVVIIVVAVLVIGGGIFLFLMLKKKKED